MRLRKVKGASEIVSNCPYVIKNYESYKGNFKSVFNNNNKIKIEIGMGKGNFIIEMAKRNPDINFIGIEKYDSVLAKAIKKIDDINNLKLIQMDAIKIDEVFSHEIDTIYLNFSDPWPKERHKNRRLTSPIFLEKYDNIFERDNNIEMKTDNRKLFEYSLVEFSKKGYTIENISLDLRTDNAKDNIETEYEKKFSELGFPIYKVVVKKNV